MYQRENLEAKHIVTFWRTCRYIRLSEKNENVTMRLLYRLTCPESVALCWPLGDVLPAVKAGLVTEGLITPPKNSHGLQKLHLEPPGISLLNTGILKVIYIFDKRSITYHTFYFFTCTQF